MTKKPQVKVQVSQPRVPSSGCLQTTSSATALEIYQPQHANAPGIRTVALKRLRPPMPYSIHPIP